MPVIICGIPSFIGQILQIAMGIQGASFIRYAFMTRIWIILLNPLATLYFIKPYRKAFSNFFRSPNYVQNFSGGEDS